MKQVSVTVLKAHLSEELTRVKRGRELIVTDRGRPIAKIIPFSPDETFHSFADLAKAGLVRLPESGSSRRAPDVPEIKDKPGRLLAALLEEREERD